MRRIAATKSQNKQKYLLEALEKNRNKLQDFYREADLVQVNPQKIVHQNKGNKVLQPQLLNQNNIILQDRDVFFQNAHRQSNMISSQMEPGTTSSTSINYLTSQPYDFIQSASAHKTSQKIFDKDKLLSYELVLPNNKSPEEKDLRYDARNRKRTLQVKKEKVRLVARKESLEDDELLDQNLLLTNRESRRNENSQNGLHSPPRKLTSMSSEEEDDHG